MSIRKKSLGQNFLVDTAIAEQIVALAGISSDSTAVEIGPGRGVLTTWIKECNPRRAILIELDTQLCWDLRHRFPDFEVINQDVCRVDFSKLVKTTDEEFIVLGNLPYSVSKYILERLVGFYKLIPKMVLMFQKEVAHRVSAHVGDSDYGVLSLLSQEFFEIKRSLTLKPEYFKPRPKVDSVVLSFIRREEPLISLRSRVIYNRLIKQVFSKRRKMVRNSLKSLLTEDIAQRVLAESSIDPKKRPQEISIKEFAHIANFIYKEIGEDL